MSKDLPYFKFYPAEWLMGSVSDLDWKIRGQFVHVMSIYWSRNCDLTEDELCRKVHTTIVKCLQNHNLIKITDGIVFIEFMEKQHEELLELKESRSRAGKIGRQTQLGQTPVKRQPLLGHIEEKRKEENNIDIRKQKFAESVMEFKDSYSKEMIEDFIRYWSEPTNNLKKFRRELQRTWDLAGRLRTWSNNNFGKKEVQLKISKPSNEIE